ncbi:(2Fe-2S)-binding protein [Corynebacterium epidermidicanis]|nr:(2Fe-2S)-binding protein [Corynebacterium epidermidicanis]
MADTFSHVVAAYPRWAAAVGPAAGGSIPFSVGSVRSKFALDSRRAEGELWFYSFLGSIFGPFAVAAVEFEQVPSLALSDDNLVLHSDAYWINWQAPGFSDFSQEAVVAAGRDAGVFFGGVIAEVAAEFGARPAPLWALVRDGAVQASLDAGNVAWDVERGVQVARWLLTGLDVAVAGEVLPGLRAVIDGEFSPVITEGQLEAAAADDAVVFAPRASCCQIYRQEGSAECTSCPRRDAGSRDAALLRYAQSLREL